MYRSTGEESSSHQVVHFIHRHPAHPPLPCTDACQVVVRIHSLFVELSTCACRSTVPTVIIKALGSLQYMQPLVFVPFCRCFHFLRLFSVLPYFSGLPRVNFTARGKIPTVKPQLVVNTVIPWITVVFGYRGHSYQANNVDLPTRANSYHAVFQPP